DPDSSHHPLSTGHWRGRAKLVFVQHLPSSPESKYREQIAHEHPARVWPHEEQPSRRAHKKGGGGQQNDPLDDFPSLFRLRSVGCRWFHIGPFNRLPRFYTLAHVAPVRLTFDVRIVTAGRAQIIWLGCFKRRLRSLP